MNLRTNYLQYLIMAALYVLSLSSCSDDEATTKVPPQTTDSQAVSLTLSLDMLTRAVGVESSTTGGGIKTQWELGDKVYLDYTKTFSDDQEILNVFTVSHIDDSDAGIAVFTNPAFIMPRGIEEGRFVYVGQKAVQTLADLHPASFNLSKQVQRGNNSLSNIGDYLHMASSYFKFTDAEELAGVVPLLKHTHALMTLQIKCPENEIGNLSKVTLSLASHNVTLLGTTNNRIELAVEEAAWEDGYTLVHILVNMGGKINTGNTWTVRVEGATSQDFYEVTYLAKQLDGGKHYTSLVSAHPSDYETTSYIEIPDFEEAGSAF